MSVAMNATSRLNRSSLATKTRAPSSRACARVSRSTGRRSSVCPFAEATLLEMERRALQHSDVRWIAISHGTREASVSWHEKIVSTPRVQLLVDAERTHYAAWGLGTTSAGHFLAFRSLAGAARLAGRGIRNRHPSGSRWQSAGSFALRDRVVACHYPEHAADMPDFDGQLRALTE